MNLEKILDTADKTLSAASKTLNAANTIHDNYRSTSTKIKYRNSEAYTSDLEEIKRCEKKTETIIKLGIFFWFLCIATTIFLCVIGNDILLQILGI